MFDMNFPHFIELIKAWQYNKTVVWFLRRVFLGTIAGLVLILSLTFGSGNTKCRPAVYPHLSCQEII